MARVPIYDGPQVAETTPGPVYRDLSGATARGRTLAQFGNALGSAGDVVDRVSARADDAAAYDVEVKLTADWLETDKKLRDQHRGVNSTGYMEAVSKWWDEAPARYGQGLNPRAGVLAGRALKARQLRALSGAQAYYATEQERAAVEGWQAANIMGVQSALSDGRPEAVAAVRQLIMERNAREAARTGKPPEWLEAENLRATSALHTGMLAKLMDRNTSEAKAYYMQNKAEIDSSRHPAIEDQLEKVGRIERSQTAADAVMALNLPLDKAMLTIEQKYSGEDEKAIKEEVTRRFTLNEAAKADAKREAMGKAWLEYEQNGKVKPSTLATLDDGQKAEILHRQKADAKARKAEAEGKTVKTDWKLYTELRQRMENGERIDLRGYVNRIGPAQMEQLLDRQQGPKKAPEAASQEQQLSAMVSVLKLKDEKKGMYQSAVQSEINAFIQRTGKTPDYAQRQDIMDRLALQGEVASGHWYAPDADRMLFEVPREDWGRFVEGTVPEKDRTAINNALKDQGIPATPENVLNLYLRAKGGAR